VPLVVRYSTNGCCRRVGDVCRASGEGRLIEPKPAGRPRQQGLLLVPLAEAERTEQHRAVALALGEEAPSGVGVDEARRALTEAQHQHRLARDAIMTLEGGLRDLAPQLTFAGARVRDALASVLEDEGAVRDLLTAYDACRVRTEQVAAALRFLEPSFVRPGWAHPDRAIPPHQTPLADAWRAVLKALEEGEVETALPEIEIP